MNGFPLDAYESQISSLYRRLRSYRDIADVVTPADSWTVRNNVSHLIDSASNNHQRFVRLQLEDAVVFPGYDAESWCSVSGIRKIDYLALVDLWNLYNTYLLELIGNIKQDSLAHVWKPSENAVPYTLDFLVRDYFAHLALHENMITAIAQADGYGAPQ